MWTIMGFAFDELLVISTVSQILTACSAGYVPAFYIFGDSLVDVGNNYYINTTVKANFPNGIDFGNPFGIPSGRFTNGRTAIDVLGDEVGLKDSIPPYMAPTTEGDIVLKGVNYASAASGIMNDTEWFFGDQINLDTQISNYAKTREDIISNIGAGAAEKLFREALHVVAVGSNDIIFGKLMKEQSWDTFLESTITRLRFQLTRLYNLGARKILVTNSAAVGCIPFERELYSSMNNDCVTIMNQQAETYNRKLNRLLLVELSKNLEASTFVYANVYLMLQDIIQNYISFGFENADSACCHTIGRYGGLIPCGAVSEVCLERSKYVFWDPFHLTEASNRIIAKYMMDGDLRYMSPINVRQLFSS